MIRGVVLYDEQDRLLGRTAVPETTFVIRHKDSLFVRTPQGVRMPGGGIGAKFIEIEPLVRDKLEPA